MRVKTPRLLSILSHGRNDEYMGNFKWRLSTILNKMADNILRLGLEEEIELLVADWGSVTPLFRDLDLTPKARRLLRFLVVPSAIAQSCDRDAGYSAVHAANSLARRAQGRFLLCGDSDLYVPIQSVENLISCLRRGHAGSLDLERSFFWASKHHIPISFTSHRPSLDELDAVIRTASPTFVKEMVNLEDFRGSGACLLLKRDMWFETRGLDERFIYWGWNDIDFHQRLRWKYRWDDLENHGVTMYHLEHYSNRFSRNRIEEGPRKMNPMQDPIAYAPNPSDWGLAHHVLPFIDGFGNLVDAEPEIAPCGELRVKVHPPFPLLWKKWKMSLRQTLRALRKWKRNLV